MPAIPGRPPVEIKTCGKVVYTCGRHAQGKPELAFADAPKQWRPRAREILEFLNGRTVAAGELTCDGDRPIVIATPWPEEGQTLRSAMRGVPPHAAVLVLRLATSVATLDRPDADLFLRRLAQELIHQGCTCTSPCACGNGLLALYRSLGETQVFTGLACTPAGFKRLHHHAHDLNAPGHIVAASEYSFTMSKYDDACAVVADAKPDKYVRRGTEAAAAARALLQPVVDDMVDNGFEAGFDPDEVRRDDTVVLVLQDNPCCNRDDCKVRVRLFEVLAVHHDDHSLVVYDTDLEYALRVDHNTVMASMHGEHWA